MKQNMSTPAAGQDGSIERITIRSNGSPAMMSMLTAEALELAVGAGNVELAARLLPMVRKNKGRRKSGMQDPVFKAFMLAAGAGSVEMVRLLAGWADPATNNCAALRFAANKGNLSCVEFLLPLSSPCSARGMALSRAAANGHAECVAAILPFARAEVKGAEALTLAVEGGWHDCIKILAGESQLQEPECKAVETAACRGDSEALILMAPHATAEQLVEAIGAAAQGGHAKCAILARELSLAAGASRRVVNQAVCDAARSAAMRGQASCLQEMLPLFRPPKGCFGLADLAREVRALEKSGRCWTPLGPAADTIEVFLEQKTLAASLGPMGAEPRRAGPRL